MAAAVTGSHAASLHGFAVKRVLRMECLLPREYLLLLLLLLLLLMVHLLPQILLLLMNLLLLLGRRLVV